jgi:general secretion pathway protein G
LQGKKKIALITLALAALAVLAGQLILFPGREIKAAREAVLRQDLFVLRSQLNQYAGDLHRRPQSLAELVAAGYIKQVPTDPMTGRNDTWVMDWSHEPKTPGIVDIHSGSRKYRDW